MAKAPRLVKYSCGCIGFPRDEDGDALIVKACDLDPADQELDLVMRDMGGKRFEPFVVKTPPEGHDCNVGSLGLLHKLQALISDGYRWQQLKRDLNG